MSKIVENLKDKTENKKTRIAVFVSGSGSNLQAIIDNIENGNFRSRGPLPRIPLRWLGRSTHAQESTFSWRYDGRHFENYMKMILSSRYRTLDTVLGRNLQSSTSF